VRNPDSARCSQYRGEFLARPPLHAADKGPLAETLEGPIAGCGLSPTYYMFRARCDAYLGSGGNSPIGKK